MITAATPLSARAAAAPTVWGLGPTQLHDRFWAARGVQVVRLGEPSEIVHDAELFLLTDPRTLTIFKLPRPIEVLSWLKPDILFIRVRDERDRGYRERAITDAGNRFIRFERIYGGPDARLARVALTPERRLALLWQKAVDPRSGWREIRQEVPAAHRSAMSGIGGYVFDRTSDADAMEFLRFLMRAWPSPEATIARAKPAGSRVWWDPSARVDAKAALIGPVWIGAGRTVDAATSLVGPRVLWDDPAARPAAEGLVWHDIEPTLTFLRPVTPRRQTTLSRAVKRLFDILFALVAIALTLPLYPLILLAIWIEDGWPFFFAHRRETLGGKQFGCLKFRSMRRDAEKIKQQLMAKNQADGPQFFMEDDPRLTRVGRFLRKTFLDELPQFWNVLLGHMAVVGPRPSPFRENQYCPPWREARLSVRPGITGLWQVRRTRQRGLDFQEWIKYDLEYVENLSWWLDLKIIWETIRLVIRGVLRS